MEIFDTLRNAKTELEFSDKVRIYLCGVTVYDDAHIGHARTIIVFDVLHRFLESQKIPVEFIQNFTDVDDKIIDRAKQEKISPLELAAKYTKNYFDDFDGLNVKRATKYPKATEHIEDMQNLISNLVDKKCAYVTKNGVYFSVSKFTEYGKLSKKKLMIWSLVLEWKLMRKKIIRLILHYGSFQSLNHHGIVHGVKVDLDGILNALQ
uniref:Cysteinyl-tRNA synthetase (CARS, cysS) n=1 Tax=uncultured marine thaumarchaeote AD1000_19_G10 TaxID=1455898 RepID=A0A075FKR0_9ARCH|nr:cysteinyl-tRNA synthetase (CARS, cysS) [uncultured marine thaumarchaeote AD1000_19_G10]